jgi:hypothetical protein
LIRRWLAAAAAALGALALACQSPEPAPDVTALVAGHLEGNALGVRPDELKAIANPRGEGVLVYVERTLYDEGQRYLVWLVLDATAYTINGQTHNLTPKLPFPSAAGRERWARTGLNPDRATETLKLVFGEN